ncbi:MAG: hypothetical protein GY863_15080 [bacterium]|nr:hypothetical protein [bacterium]
METKKLIFMDSIYKNIVGDEIKPRTAQIGLTEEKKGSFRNKEGRTQSCIVLSDKCQTLAEFEYAITAVYEDLKILKKQAREFFKQEEDQK